MKIKKIEWNRTINLKTKKITQEKHFSSDEQIRVQL